MKGDDYILLLLVVAVYFVAVVFVVVFVVLQFLHYTSFYIGMLLESSRFSVNSSRVYFGLCVHF